MFHSPREHAWLKGQHGSGLRIVVCLVRFRHPSVMSHMLPHLSLNTSAGSFSPTSPFFRPSSPSLSCPLELDQETLRDSRRSGGYLLNMHLPQVMSPIRTQSGDFEPQGIELDRNPGKDLEPRTIELDRHIGTDPFQIPERILEDDYQNPITEDTEETENFDVDMPYVRSRIDFDCARILKMENFRKVLASPLYVHGRGENYGSSQKICSFRETRSKNNAEERGKCKTYSS